MNAKIPHVFPCVLLAFALTALINTVAAQEQGAATDHYIVDGQRIELLTSERYKALALKPGISDARKRTIENNLKASGVGEVESMPLLEKYGIFLVRANEDVGPTAFQNGIESLNWGEEIESEVPVYSFGGADAVLVNEFIVQFESDVSESRINEIIAINSATIIKQYAKIKNRYLLTFDGKTLREALALSNKIHESDEVTFSEPNFIQIIPARPQIRGSAPGQRTPSPAATTPNDPLYNKQWGLNNTGSVGVADADIDAAEAWDIEKGVPSVIIAIIDEGVDILHEDLKDKIVTPYDATDGDNNQQPNPWNGHGTACAGIAAAISHNGIGITGVAWNVKILPVRIAYSNCATCGWITSSTIIEDGIRTAVDRNANVLSNSWGGGAPSSAINSGIDYAIANGRVVVFAAGNASGPVSYPANLSSSKTIISVSATNEWDEFKTKTSQDGETWWGSNFGSQINIAAPGVHIYTTDISGTAGYVDGNYVSNFNGTSSATPFVAGAAALLLSKEPSLTPVEVRARLQQFADDLGAPGFDTQFGHGRLNVNNAIIGHLLLNVALVLDSDKRLSKGQTTSARATVTDNMGAPVAGKTVSFVIADTTLATVSPATAVTNGAGIATTTVRGEVRGLEKKTVLTATANGVDSNPVTVRVPDVSPAGLLLLLAGFGWLLYRQSGTRRQ